MKFYKVKGQFLGKEIVEVIIDNEYKNKVKIELWIKKENFENIPTGEKHYDFIRIFIDDPKGYLQLLKHKREAEVARKYIKQLGLKILKIYF